MNRSSYTRLFLGAFISKPDRVDSSYEAAIVLWGKDNESDSIAVLDAVSIGTKDLSVETKELWKRQRASCLPGVDGGDWRRPASAGATPVKLVSPTPEEWLVRVPYAGLLYKVTVGKGAADGNYKYLLDNVDHDLSDMEIDLL